jgi:hypothetical protein
MKSNSPVLVDTNILIYAFAGTEPYASFVHSLIQTETIASSPIIINEFLCGVHDDQRDFYTRFFEDITVYPVTTAIAVQAALYRKTHLSRKSKLILPDALIGATCKVHTIPLLTYNTKDYPMDDVEKIHLV